ncbi:Inactive tyrosine-protein kinase 7 [Cichlidogyrus casuarinus]|uniref:Inactive tyrosine-protein kinase 7 n=1 Tax=Cichlidogyrus casuarinus TaxID=1844966 RepID=A0ABD2QFF1_9PLAT
MSLIRVAKPKISQVSEEQVIPLNKSLLLNCVVVGKPQPTVIWSVTLNSSNAKEYSYSYNQATIPIDGRTGSNQIQVLKNGTLHIQQTKVTDSGLYKCVAVLLGNYTSLPVGDQISIHVRVLTELDYVSYEQKKEAKFQQEARVTKMVSIVVGCALLYLFLMCLVTACCSLGMMKKRRRRSRSGQGFHSDLNGTTLGLGSQFRRENLLANGKPCNYLMDGNQIFSKGHQGNGSMHPLLGNTAGLLNSYNAPLPNPVASNNSSLLYSTQMGAHSTANSSTGQAVSTNTTTMPHFFDFTLTTAVTGSAAGQGNLLNTTYQSCYQGTADTLSANGSTTTRDRIALKGSQWLFALATPTLSKVSDCIYPEMKELMHAGSNGSYAGLEPTTMNSDGYWPVEYNGAGLAHPPTAARSIVSGASNPSLTPGHSQSLSTTVPNYPKSKLKMEKKLGEGEFGEVWVARGRGLREGEDDTSILVKTLSDANKDDPWMINEFQRQMELFSAANLQSCNMTRLLAYSFRDSPHLFICEYGELGDLKEYLVNYRNVNGCQLQRSQKLSICKTIASALDYLSSSCDLVHRDIAARNVLVTRDRGVKLSLLGLSRDKYAQEYYRPKNCDRAFPLRWMAPECVESNRKMFQLNDLPSNNRNSLDFSSASDVWSFAVFFSEVFTCGQLPLASLSDAEILEIFLGNASFRHELAAETPLELRGLLNRCLSHQPEYRPSFAEIVTNLSSLT